jgi:hypothetical protein
MDILPRYFKLGSLSSLFQESISQHGKFVVQSRENRRNSG